MFLDQHLCRSWSGKTSFAFFVKFTLATRVRCFYISVIHLSFPSDYRDKLWEGHRSRGIGIGLLSDRNSVPVSTKYVDPGTCLA